MSSPKTFPQFPNLPLEIRNKIWNHSLHTPRLLQIVYHHKPLAYGIPATFKVRSSSTGGRPPATLSVNRESRAEALRHLTLLHGAYWNLAVDSPYFEVTQIRDDQVLVLPDFMRGGHLGRFEKVAVDWLYVDWIRDTAGCCEKRMIFQTERKGYENLVDILNSAPSIKSCAIVYRKHTLERDFIIPYQSWRLGPLTEETTLATDYETVVGKAREEIEGKKVALRRDDVEMEFLAIHDRERERLPIGQRYRPPPNPYEYDWFG